MASNSPQLSLQAWVSEAVSERPGLDANKLHKAAEFLSSRGGEDNLCRTGIELASLLMELELDTASIVSGLAYRFVRSGTLDIVQLKAVLGEEVSHLTEEVVKMASVGLLEFSNAPVLTSESRSQVANVRNMLVALIDDVRVAVIKLAERVVALRHAKNSSTSRKLRIARETLNFFAPLANRLGVWRLKWELEDLALRYLEPETYSSIARQLAGRRQERESQIQDVVRQLQKMFNQPLSDPGTEVNPSTRVQVEGRAKHIYSIWRKMRRKEIGFTEVYDVNAVRVLVSSVADCYQALGIVHARWRHIPLELDDYIANPKDNGYRSIHTAVNLTDGKVLEIQIKTREMHRDAELGICAHWAYKDDSGSEDGFFEAKLNWLRKVLLWSEESGSFSGFREELRANIEQDRIYVYTPKGHVLDLTLGATPLDFAYRVHTEVGNHCYAARVDGESARLNSVLETGQCVEILVREDATPDRNWLNPALGYLCTARARAKVQNWFKQLGNHQNISAGETLLAETVASLGVELRLEPLLSLLGFDSREDLLYAVGVGDLSILDLIRFAETADASEKQVALIQAETLFLQIRCKDRRNLLRDIMEVFAQQEFQMLSINTQTDRHTGQVSFDISVTASSMMKFASLLGNIKQLDGVIEAVRIINLKEY